VTLGRGGGMEYWVDLMVVELLSSVDDEAAIGILGQP